MAIKTRFWTPLTQKLSKRQFLSSVSAAAASFGLAKSKSAQAQSDQYDAIIVGGGTAGLPAAIFAAKRGGRVLIVEAAPVIGGTLFLSSAQMSAAGTKLQKSKGVTGDSWQSHYDDVMRLSKNTADPDIVRLATQNAAAAFDWMTDSGYEVYPDHPVKGTNHDPFSHARYAWSPEGGMAVLAVLEQQLQPHIESSAVTIKVNTEATDLVQDDSGAVIGVVTVNADGKTERYMGKNMVLASGGYASNAGMFEDLEGAIDYVDASYPYSQGAGITLGLSVGGYVRYAENRLPLFGAILAENTYPSALAAVARHYPPVRPPWEIIVDAQGKRFVQEDIPSHDAYEEALLKQPGEQCWTVWDQEIHSQAPPLVQSSFGQMLPEDIPDAYDEGRPNFFKADTLEKLVETMGIDAEGLQSTVTKYNRAVVTGVDELGRTHLPLPIEKPPFYGLHLRSWTLTSSAGLAVDNELRVIKQDGTPVGNLYAAGEILGAGATSGRGRSGGSMVTPAIAFGKLLGERILQFEV